MRITTHINYPKQIVPVREPIRLRLDGSPDRRPNWTQSENATLTKLWERGLSASAIADQMPGRNRNMVIGQAHRLNLPSRPSPIKRSA